MIQSKKNKMQIKLSPKILGVVFASFVLCAPFGVHSVWVTRTSKRVSALSRAELRDSLRGSTFRCGHRLIRIHWFVASRDLAVGDTIDDVVHLGGPF